MASKQKKIFSEQGDFTMSLNLKLFFLEIEWRRAMQLEFPKKID